MIRFERREPHRVDDWQGVFAVTVHGYLHLPPGVEMMVQSAEAADELERLMAVVEAARAWRASRSVVEEYNLDDNEIRLEMAVDALDRETTP